MYNDYVTENFNIQDLLTHRKGLGVGDLMFFLMVPTLQLRTS
jgi:hypothetical protein